MTADPPRPARASRTVLFLAILVILPGLALVAPPSRAARHPHDPVEGGSDTLRLSVDEAIRHALAHGAEMRIAEAGVAVAGGRIREALAEALPQVNGSFGYTRRFDSVFRGVEADSGLGSLFQNSPFGAIHTWKADLTATQILFSRRVGAGIAAARAYRRSTDATRRETAAQVTLAVRAAYYDAALAARSEQIAAAGLAQARAHLRDVELDRREGTRAEYDVIRARVDAQNEEPVLVAARNARAIAGLELKRLLGVPLDRPIALTTPLAFEGAVVPVLDEPALPAADRAALAAAEADVEGRRRLLALERAQRWPDLKATSTLSHQAFPPGGRPELDLFHRNLEATVLLDFPLFLGFRTSGGIQRAGAELRQAEAARDRMRQTVDLEIETGRQEARRALATLAARRGTVALATRAHELALIRFGNGLSTQLEVADARLGRETAELNEARATRDYRVALARLEFALGAPLPVRPRPLSEIARPDPEEERSQ